MLKKRAFRIFIYFAAVLLVIWSLAPIAWMVISSITPSNQMVQSERILPDNFTVDRYKMVLFGQQIEGVNRNAAAQSAVFRRALVNSVILAALRWERRPAMLLPVFSSAAVKCSSLRRCFSSCSRPLHC